MLPHLSEVDTPKREPVRQAVFGGGPLCQRHSRRLNIDPGDGQFRLPLQEQQPQQAGAAAQIADPQPGGELRQGGQQKGVRAGRNSVSSQTNRSPSGFRYSQCSTPSPPIERFYYYIGEPLSSASPGGKQKNRLRIGPETVLCIPLRIIPRGRWRRWGRCRCKNRSPGKRQNRSRTDRRPG